jgi:hypothetical protein
MKAIHAKHVWVPIQLARSRSPGKEVILISPSQSHPYLRIRFGVPFF